MYAIRSYYDKTIGGVPFLDTQYTVFGEVVKGLNIVDSIAAVKCNGSDRPLVDIRILKVETVSDGVVQNSMTLNGKIKEKSLTSLSFRVGGPLARLIVKQGDLFVKDRNNFV